MLTTYEERRIFCNSKIDKVREIASKNDLWFIVICRANPINKNLTSHVYYFEDVNDYKEALEHYMFKYENLRERIGISYWMETNDDFVSGGMLDDYKN